MRTADSIAGKTYSGSKTRWQMKMFCEQRFLDSPRAEFMIRPVCSEKFKED
jgi:hypothetical protein